MNYLGIIALLIVVAVGAWWAGSSMQPVAVPDEDANATTTYERAVEKAERVVETTKEKVEETTAATGPSVTIYDGMNVPSGTKVVNLSGKGYTGSLKAEVRQLTELRELNLSNNKFTGLPAEVGQLSKLEVLNLSNNPFTGLPYELANLKNLKILDLRGTQYAKADLEVIKKGLPASTQILVD